MYWPNIETPRLKSNDKLAGPIILISGFLLSLWTNCVVLIGVNSDRYWAQDSNICYIVFIAFITHVIVSLSTTSALIQGFKTNDSDLLKPWMYTKATELIGLLIGIMLLCAQYRQRYVGVIPIALIVLLIGNYILLCIYTSWKKMKENPNPPPSGPPQPASNFDLESVNLGMPPSYDSFANQMVK